MKKRIICLLFAVLILLSTLGPGVMAETVLAASDEAIRILKLEEGFSATPYWDYAQWTVGYGTKCPDDKLEEYRQNGISEEEAEQLLRTYIAKFESELHAFMIRTGVWLDQKQFDALLLFSYNCGTGWSYDINGGLYNAVVNRAQGNEMVNALARWCNAGGEIKSFLLRRRLCEANIYLNGIYSQTASEQFGYVLYDACGGTARPNVQGYDTVLTSQIQSTATREGYSFVGWFTEKSGGEEVTVLDGTVRNSRLYARWQQDGVSGQAPEEQTGIDVTVTANGVNIRSGPGTGYTVTGSANTGDRLTVTETKEDADYLWGRFRGGWICLKYTNYDAVTAPEEEPPAEPETHMGTVKVNDCLRVRSGPSTGYDVVEYLKNGTRVEILEEKLVGSMVWGRIETGWLSMDYVELDSTEAQPPEATGPETDATETTPPTPAPEVTEPTQPSETQEDTAGRWNGTVKVSDVLRVRSGPSTNDPVVGYLKAGERVTVTEKTDSGSMTWGKTEKGWISMDYVVLDPDSAEEAKTVTGTVQVSDLLRVRSGPGTSYTIAAYLKNGTHVEITEQKNVGGTLWGKTEKGWICLDYVRLNETEQQQKQTKTVTADCLRVRSAPGTANSIVGYLYKDAKVEILETKTVNGAAWGKTAKGWISMDYVK